MSEPIRILHTESSPSLGGQELRILLEMEHMAGLGYESVLAARADTPILEEARRRGFTAYPVKIRSSVDPRAIVTFGSIIRRHRIDIVNAHNSKDGWNALLAARLLGKKTIRARHIASAIRTKGLSPMIYGSLADVVMTTGEGIKAGLVAQGVEAGKIISVPTGIEMARFETAQPGTLRNDLGIPPDAPLVGQIAVLRSDRGPDVFVEAAKIAIAQGSPAYFVLIGEGPSRKKLEPMIAEAGLQDRIKLSGFRRDIPEVLADLDIFVLASRSAEGVSQGVLQAHCARVPVVATRQIGLTEIAIDGQTALTVAPENPAALSEAIQNLLQHPSQASNLAEGGHRLVELNHTLQHMLLKMDRLYRNLLSETLQN